MPGNEFRDASNQESLEPLSPVRAEYNQVGTPLYSYIKDSGSCFSLNNACADVESGRAKHLACLIHRFLRMSEFLFNYFVLVGRIPRRHLWWDREYVRFHYSQDEHFGAFRARLRNEGLSCRL